ncbi:MAG TPA: SRPBCC domain-containing protein [Thermoanaerobaculia bacterium]|nr:SRPBCC domain-containing protein [Thermoanaerobaculia bacterium]
MASPQTSAPIALKVSRTFPAPREKVFRAWTETEALKSWFAPSEKYVTRIARLDVRVGGAYRIEMEIEGKAHIVAGTYREVNPPERLVFTWKWETEPRHGDSLVTIEFLDRGGKTEVILTHEKFPSEAARDEHNKGWTGCLDRLEKFLS